MIFFLYIRIQFEKKCADASKLKTSRQQGLVSQDCEKWKLNPNVNPQTNRPIKNGGPTYKQFEKKCADASNSSHKNQDTTSDCDKWKMNPKVNPITNRAMKSGGPIYKKFQKKCGESSSSPQDDKPIAVRNPVDAFPPVLLDYDYLNFYMMIQDRWTDIIEDTPPRMYSAIVPYYTRLTNSLRKLCLDRAYFIVEQAVFFGKADQLPHFYVPDMNKLKQRPYYDPESSQTLEESVQKIKSIYAQFKNRSKQPDELYQYYIKILEILRKYKVLNVYLIESMPAKVVMDLSHVNFESKVTAEMMKPYEEMCHALYRFLKKAKYGELQELVETRLFLSEWMRYYSTGQWDRLIGKRGTATPDPETKKYVTDLVNLVFVDYKRTMDRFYSGLRRNIPFHYGE
jgi:hypothetical protein